MSKELETRRNKLRKWAPLLTNILSSIGIYRYRKKNLKKTADEFIDSIRRTMGVHAVILFGYKSNEDVKTTV
jgi:hypothetical protein